ncbi:MAG: STAS domain-containing protein [Burkholderiaceae bacterium]|nr:STAS domain-containing protein [Burkholderiaceae bacterium]
MYDRLDSRLTRYFPFLAWLQPNNRVHWRADLIAGITVALVLVPQSMAYAQLAGLPPAYGLYTAFLPVIVAAMWGSCAQVATGPVAVISLLTATTVSGIALPGSAQYVAYAVTLALLVGIVQLSLGVFRLGALVNLLSHPVVGGFTAAAAIIIALSQFNKILGLPLARSQFFFGDVWAMLVQLEQVHFPTMAFGVAALVALLLMRYKAPRLPGVLLVTVIGTFLSVGIEFSATRTVEHAKLDDPAALEAIGELLRERATLGELRKRRSELSIQRDEWMKSEAAFREELASLAYRADLLDLRIEALARQVESRRRLLARIAFAEATHTDEGFVLHGPDHARKRVWRVSELGQEKVTLGSGGEVVGAVPSGLPSLEIPRLTLDSFATLLASALVISLVGFMETISVAKAVTTRTRARLDPNQELVGQGLANLVGSFTQSYPASGSFSRTALNYSSGAKSGLSSVIAGLVVMLVLLFLTPLLHHLPQAVLAAVIMLAVSSLIDFKSQIHAWRANRHDGVAGAAAFVGTLLFAPNLDLGILLGVGLSIISFMYRTMRPRVNILGRHAGGALRDAAEHDLELSSYVVALRFDGQLYFGNVSYFEDTVLGIPARFPKVQKILVVGTGITQLDASGDEVVRHLAERLRLGGVDLAFSGLEPRILEVLRATGTYEVVGAENFFIDSNRALEELARRVVAPDFNPEEFVLRRKPAGDAPA